MQKLTIGKLADGAGINLETIRYYERIRAAPGAVTGPMQLFTSEGLLLFGERVSWGFPSTTSAPC